jgi:hypothetical protein
MEPEFGQMPVPGSPCSGGFPAFSLVIRDLAGETSSLQTASTAIQSAAAETSRAHRGIGREIPAIPRVLAVPLWRIRTGDCGVRPWRVPRSAFVSVAKFGGSDSLPIRLSEGRRSTGLPAPHGGRMVRDHAVQNESVSRNWAGELTASGR